MKKNVGIFLPSHSGSSRGYEFAALETHVSTLLSAYFETTTSDCLCKYSKKMPSEEGLPAVVFHPHKSKKCWRKIREIVQVNPATEFYLFAGFNDIMERTLGKHPNLKPMYQGSDQTEKFIEAIKGLAVSAAHNEVSGENIDIL